jgi:pimeloyl-ACP methyl ester carboxylesterase
MSVHVRPPDRRASLALPDGRRLAWSEWGPVDGAPVVFCTGAGMSGALGFGADGLAPLGLRLLAPDRPGLGASDPDPAKTLTSFAADVGALLGGRPASVVGFSQGAPFALAIAAAGHATALALVSAQDELAHPALRPRLTPQLAELVAAARDEPAALAARVARTAGAEWLWNMILTMSAPEDRAVYTAEPFATLYRTALDEGFAQGPAGYARDLAIALGPWPYRPEDIAVPVHLWFGARDTSPVHSPDHGATLSARLPDATLTVVQDEGGAVLWTRAGDILAALAAA